VWEIPQYEIHWNDTHGVNTDEWIDSNNWTDCTRL